MRHRRKESKLGRKSAHRQAMLANMASALILHKRINTTLAKGKALRVYVEPLITKSKDDSTHSRRIVFSYLQNKDAVSELFREISVKVANRPGGYTRILKTGTRLGDNAEMCLIELVDYNENLLGTKEEAKAKASRRRRGSGKKKTEEPAAKPVETKKPVASEPEVTEEPQDIAVEETKEETVAEITEVVEETAETPVEEAQTNEEPAVTEENPLAEATEEAPEAEVKETAGEIPAEDTPEIKDEDKEEEKK